MRVRFVALIAIALCCRAVEASAQVRYQEPPPPIPRILDETDANPTVVLSPNAAWLLLMERASSHIADLAEPVLNLAGRRIWPRTNGGAQGLFYRKLSLRSVTGSTAREIAIPASNRIASPLWSPDSRYVAFTVSTADRITLWVADVENGKTRRVSEKSLNGAAMDQPCIWMSTSDALLCRTVPTPRAQPPNPMAPPDGPIVQESTGNERPRVWVYQGFLRNAADEALFDYYFVTQLAILRLDGGSKPVGQRGLHVMAVPSPDARYVMVRTVHRPYSYNVGFAGFPTETAIWDLSGRVIQTIADTPLQETVALRGRDYVRTGPREVAWRSDAPATLVWAQAVDDGNPGVSASVRDHVLAWAAPFEGSAITIAKLEYRFRGIQWVSGRFALVTESWLTTKRARVWAISPSEHDASKVVFQWSSEDTYADPGTFLLRPNPQGAQIVQVSSDGHWAYLTGPGASVDGDRPFLDRVDLTTLRKERLWRSEAPYYESVVSVLDDDRFVTRRESPQEFPNYFLREHRPGGALVPLTTFENPAPELAQASVELITYTRADGVQLSARLHLPPGYHKRQGPLPFLFWTYPREFNDAAAASRVRGSPYRFTAMGTLGSPNHLLALIQGYGVLDDIAMPVVGDTTQRPVDTFVDQLVANAKAAVDAVVGMGVADPNRIAIGGMSAGAYVTANLVTHSNLFRAGIALSGLYNLTLMPFGFQNESRTLWQARETYLKISPVAWVDQLRAPLLIIHGDADSGSATFVEQSDRLFAAIKGSGGRARYVRLPYEDHGYVARESVGHVLWEMLEWLDRYVKTPEAQTTSPTR